MMRRGTWVAVAALLLALTALPVLARTMYARYAAPVRADRKLGAATVGNLRQGERIEVSGREGRYFRVTYGGQTGWVYFNKLTEDEPEDIGALLGGGLGGQGIELTELEAGGALRGLSPVAEDYARQAEIPDWTVDAVEAMQARAVTGYELEEFQREGGLGEYGGTGE